MFEVFIFSAGTESDGLEQDGESNNLVDTLEVHETGTSLLAPTPGSACAGAESAGLDETGEFNDGDATYLDPNDTG